MIFLRWPDLERFQLENCHGAHGQSGDDPCQPELFLCNKPRKKIKFIGTLEEKKLQECMEPE